MCVKVLNLRWVFVFFAALSFGLLSAPLTPLGRAYAGAGEVGQPAPDFTLQDLAKW